MSGDALTAKSAGRQRTNRKTRWLMILVAVGALLMVGTVTADVVLSYVVFNNTAVNATSDYKFVNGGNYGTANGYGLITNTITAGNQISTALSGIQDVNVEIYDVIEFDVAVATPTTSHVTTATVINPAVVAPANVVCAYAFVSDAVPTAGTVAVAGEPAGCGAVTPTLGAIGTACTAAGSGTGVATINLLSGAVVGTPGTCNLPTGAAVNDIIEYVSYAIYVTGAVAAGALNTIGIPVAAP